MNSIFLVLSYLLSIILIVSGFLYLRQKGTGRVQDGRAVADVRGGRARRQERRNRDRGQQEPQAHQPEGDEDDEDDLAADELGARFGGGARMSKEERKRLQKLARKQAREDLLRTQEHKQAKEDERRAARAAKQAAFEEKEKQELAAAIQAELEEKKRLDEEYMQWQGEIKLESAGNAEEEASSHSQSMLSEFIQFIKKRKVVSVDELSDEFRIPSSSVVSRLQALEESGLITGILDDRGKFIYLTEEELDAVARFIERRGRVSLSDVVAESNKLLKLSPTE